MDIITIIAYIGSVAMVLGYLPQAIINYIALLGWCPKDNTEIFTLDELTKVFDISGISKSPAVFDYDKLEWFNGEYIKRMDDDAYRAKAKKYHPDALKAQGLPDEMIGKANEKMGRINEAWTRIKEAKGI